MKLELDRAISPLLQEKNIAPEEALKKFFDNNYFLIEIVVEEFGVYTAFEEPVFAETMEVDIEPFQDKLDDLLERFIEDFPGYPIKDGSYNEVVSFCILNGLESIHTIELNDQDLSALLMELVHEYESELAELLDYTNKCGCGYRPIDVFRFMFKHVLGDNLEDAMDMLVNK